MYDGVQIDTPTLLSRPASVRIATSLDEKALYVLLRNLEIANAMGFARSEAKAWAHINGVCRGQGGIAGVIDGPDGSLIGSIGITAAQPWYSEDYFLSEVWCFVDPEHRKGTRHGAALFDFAKWHQQDMSIKLGHNIPLEISFLSYRRVAAKERLWRKAGRWIGSTFMIGGSSD